MWSFSSIQSEHRCCFLWGLFFHCIRRTWSGTNEIWVLLYFYSIALHIGANFFLKKITPEHLWQLSNMHNSFVFSCNSIPQPRVGYEAQLHAMKLRAIQHTLRSNLRAGCHRLLPNCWDKQWKLLLCLELLSSLEHQNNPLPPLQIKIGEWAVPQGKISYEG